jgi:hypothetical protein
LSETAIPPDANDYRHQPPFLNMPKNELDPEDPMEMRAIALPSSEDTTDAMTDCFVEEFMRLGYNHKQLLALFRNPHYTGLHMVLDLKGEPYVRDRIGEMFARWGRPVEWPAPSAAPVREVRSDDELDPASSAAAKPFKSQTCLL